MSIMPWVLALAGVLTPLCVRAQTSGDFGGVREGDRVRVRTSDGQLLSGRYVTSSVSAPGLEVGKGLAPVALGEVDSIWVRGNSSKIGAIVGSVLGAGGGLGLGYLACELGSDGHGCQEGGRVALFTVAGAAAGLGLGALVGSAFPKWRLRYARTEITLRLQPTRRGVTLSTSIGL